VLWLFVFSKLQHWQVRSLYWPLASWHLQFPESASTDLLGKASSIERSGNERLYSPGGQENDSRSSELSEVEVHREQPVVSICVGNFRQIDRGFILFQLPFPEIGDVEEWLPFLPVNIMRTSVPLEILCVGIIIRVEFRRWVPSNDAQGGVSVGFRFVLATKTLCSAKPTCKYLWCIGY